jgi:hypothetical protein
MKHASWADLQTTWVTGLEKQTTPSMATKTVVNQK